MQHTLTLSILGRPVRFTPLCRVEGCRNPLHPGPCKGSKRGGGSGGAGKTAKKAVAKTPVAEKKTAAPKKAAPKKAVGQSREARIAEVKELTSKTEHHGVPMKRIKEIFAALGGGEGRRFDRPTMTLHYNERNGTGEMRLVGRGYEAVVNRKGEPPKTRTFRDIAAANSFVRGNLLISGR